MGTMRQESQDPSDQGLFTGAEAVSELQLKAPSVDSEPAPGQGLLGFSGLLLKFWPFALCESACGNNTGRGSETPFREISCGDDEPDRKVSFGEALGHSEGGVPEQHLVRFRVHLQLRNVPHPRREARHRW